MTDDQLDRLIDQARATYHAPPEPPLDALWSGIAQRRAERAGAPHSPRRWSVRHLRATPWFPLASASALAAALVLSFTLGRVTAPTAPTSATGTLASGQATTTAGTPAPAFERTPETSATTELLGRTVVLLSALPREANDPSSAGRFAQQADELLMTTRLLLDSRAAERDATLRALLQDLELVLAQVARLRAGETRTERELITEAMEQQDLVPRIRTVAAGLGAD
jgi:hypothetical protein